MASLTPGEHGTLGGYVCICKSPHLLLLLLLLLFILVVKRDAMTQWVSRSSEGVVRPERKTGGTPAPHASEAGTPITHEKQS